MESRKYVEVRVGGGVPQFIALEDWQRMDADRRAGYTVVSAELTEDQMRERQTQHERNAAERGSYAADSPPAGADGSGGGP